MGSSEQARPESTRASVLNTDRDSLPGSRYHHPGLRPVDLAFGPGPFPAPDQPPAPAAVAPSLSDLHPCGGSPPPMTCAGVSSLMCSCSLHRNAQLHTQRTRDPHNRGAAGVAFSDNTHAYLHSVATRLAHSMSRCWLSFTMISAVPIRRNPGAVESATPFGSGPGVRGRPSVRRQFAADFSTPRGGREQPRARLPGPLRADRR